MFFQTWHTKEVTIWTRSVLKELWNHHKIFCSKCETINEKFSALSVYTRTACAIKEYVDFKLTDFGKFLFLLRVSPIFAVQICYLWLDGHKLRYAFFSVFWPPTHLWLCFTLLQKFNFKLMVIFYQPPTHLNGIT